MVYCGHLNVIEHLKIFKERIRCLFASNDLIRSGLSGFGGPDQPIGRRYVVRHVACTHCNRFSADLALKVHSL